MRATHHSLTTTASRRFLSLAAAVFVVAGSLAVSSNVEAQVLPKYDRFQPLSQRSSPGLAARFADLAGRTGHMQPVRVILETTGDVSVFYAPQATEYAMKSPAQVGLMVGHCYRMKISNLPGQPGVEVFPTIELIDRMHPPAGQQDNFPIPVHLTSDDLEMALEGNLVTRVVYVEQPQLAAPYELDRATRTQNLLKQDNAVAEADRRGRPVAIIRIGGRLPSTHGEPVSFYGTGGPITESRPTMPLKNDAPKPAQKQEAPE